jgi:N-methylhydantoinase B
MNAHESVSDVDPITLAVVQSRLDHISRQMGWVMMCTARSPIFQMHDFSCFVTDETGAVVSQADGIPIHTGSGGFTVRALMAAFGSDIRDGDVYLANDPYLAGGNHLPDWVIARPVFADGTLCGFCCNRAHQSDIGGGAAGTYNPKATEIYHEGLRLPPLRLVEQGRLREDVWSLLLANSRTPVLLDGDLRAMIGSTSVGAKQLLELVQELGGRSIAQAYLNGVLSYAERRMRLAIAELPPGLYPGEDSMNTDCFERQAIAVRVLLTVAEDSITVDFSGTSPQMKGFKNSSIANTHSAVYAAISAFFEPDLPRNEGSYRAIRIIAPEGSLVNPRPPAATTYCTAFPAHEIIHACWQALSAARPQDACAGWGKATSPISVGRQPDGSHYVLYHWNGLPAGGAVCGRDGFNQIAFLPTLGGLMLPNVETWEQQYPVVIWQQEFREDGGGPGRWRGGTGVAYVADIQTAAVHSLRNEGLFDPSGYGLDGGGFGKAAEVRIKPVETDEFVPPQYGLLELPPVRLTVLSAGGGGLGDPYERAPEAVLQDVQDELVSVERAEADYGVVLCNDSSGVDEALTSQCRRLARG